jgi:4-amino-4-deoxy-L-arabinose transferase-like glycosyltransferase
MRHRLDPAVGNRVQRSSAGAGRWLPFSDRVHEEENSDEAPARSRAIRIMAAAAMFALAVAIVMTFVVPTFDLDEALYRRIAEEMKSGHHVLQTWDGKPFYEKPPTYVWTILAADAAIDGDPAHVSILAARLPSLCFSLLTVAALGLFWRRFGPACASAFDADVATLPPWLFSPLTPMVAYAAGILPFAGAATVLLDPMLTFFLLAPLLVFTRALMRRGTLELSGRETIVTGIGMAGAVAVKGLIGIVLPAFAIFCHAVIAAIQGDSEAEGFARRFASRTARAIRATAPSFALAVILSAAFYTALYLREGRAFLYEFFVRQHFVRGTSALQGHSGSVFYHSLVVLILGGSLVAFLFVLLATPLRSRVSYERWGFPLSWALATIVFYSAMSTKLPNYTWPVWPAFSIALCVLLVRSTAADSIDRRRMLSSIVRKLAYVSAATIALAFMAAGAGAERLLLHGHLSPRARAMADSVEPVPLSVRVAFVIIGLAAASQWLFVRDFGRNLRRHASAIWRPITCAAVANGIILLASALVIVPFADLRMREPLVRLSAVASREHVTGGDLTTIGLFSPTVSSNYAAGTPLQVGRGTAAEFSSPAQHLLLVPEWRSQICTDHGFALLEQDGYVVLCEKNAPPLKPRAASLR